MKSCVVLGGERAGIVQAPWPRRYVFCAGHWGVIQQQSAVKAGRA